MNNVEAVRSLRERFQSLASKYDQLFHCYVFGEWQKLQRDDIAALAIAACPVPNSKVIDSTDGSFYLAPPETDEGAAQAALARFRATAEQVKEDLPLRTLPGFNRFHVEAQQVVMVAPDGSLVSSGGSTGVIRGVELRWLDHLYAVLNPPTRHIDGPMRPNCRVRALRCDVFHASATALDVLEAESDGLMSLEEFAPLLGLKEKRLRNISSEKHRPLPSPAIAARPARYSYAALIAWALEVLPEKCDLLPTTYLEARQVVSARVSTAG